jgi:hypothetical protein
MSHHMTREQIVSDLWQYFQQTEQHLHELTMEDLYERTMKLIEINQVTKEVTIQDVEHKKEDTENRQNKQTNANS